jgi:hypothetical protein
MNRRLILFGYAAFAALCVIDGTARAQIFVTNLDPGTIGEYTTSGATVNAMLVSGLDDPSGIAVVAASVPDRSSSCSLLLLGVAATFVFKSLLRAPA